MSSERTIKQSGRCSPCGMSAPERKPEAYCAQSSGTEPQVLDENGLLYQSLVLKWTSLCNIQWTDPNLRCAFFTAYTSYGRFESEVIQALTSRMVNKKTVGPSSSPCKQRGSNGSSGTVCFHTLKSPLRKRVPSSFLRLTGCTCTLKYLEMYSTSACVPLPCWPKTQTLCCLPLPSGGKSAAEDEETELLHPGPNRTGTLAGRDTGAAAAEVACVAVAAAVVVLSASSPGPANAAADAGGCGSSSGGSGAGACSGGRVGEHNRRAGTCAGRTAAASAHGCAVLRAGTINGAT
mmetsp:Transcript_53752/g.174778  ORF Transcript_53752/g.174778 Transcript_53752/m.174778 type:complete len:292 (+) Transcript_53752:958-1833(+)